MNGCCDFFVSAFSLSLSQISDSHASNQHRIIYIDKLTLLQIYCNVYLFISILLRCTRALIASLKHINNKIVVRAAIGNGKIAMEQHASIFINFRSAMRVNLIFFFFHLLHLLKLICLECQMLSCVCLFQAVVTSTLECYIWERIAIVVVSASIAVIKNSQHPTKSRSAGGCVRHR